MRRNAKFNLAKLGGAGVDYIEDFYGLMSDSINANDRSDRIVLAWDIASDRVERAMRGELAPRPRADWLERGAQIAVSSSADEVPITHTTNGDLQLVALPYDIVAIRQADAEAALRWRLAVRAALHPVISSGGRLIGLTQEGDYVVEVTS